MFSLFTLLLCLFHQHILTFITVTISWTSANLIKIRSTHLLPIFYRFWVLFGRSCSRSNNTPLRVASGVSMNTWSQIYISQSEIESTLQNNQSEKRFLRVFGVVQKIHGSLHAIWHWQRIDRYVTIIWHRWVETIA
jgi:hypothetical protein